MASKIVTVSRPAGERDVPVLGCVGPRPRIVHLDEAYFAVLREQGVVIKETAVVVEPETAAPSDNTRKGGKG